jgi:hypothetical protein
VTAVDVVVVVVGLLFGYRLVANYLSPNVGDRRESVQRPTPKSLLPQTPSWFAVLGVSENASIADIERAYRAKINQYHPDKVAQMGEDIRQLAEAKSKEINVADETALKWRGR